VLRVAGLGGFIAGIAALVVMATSWRDPIYLSHPPAIGMAGISIRVGQGMLLVTARGDEGVKIWPGWRAGELIEGARPGDWRTARFPARPALRCRKGWRFHPRRAMRRVSRTVEW